MRDTGSSRAFMRREDYQPPTTPADSLCRQFMVTCIRCRSHRLKLVTQYDEESGEIALVLHCPSCRSAEKLKVA